MRQNSFSSYYKLYQSEKCSMVRWLRAWALRMWLVHAVQSLLIVEWSRMNCLAASWGITDFAEAETLPPPVVLHTWEHSSSDDASNIYAFLATSGILSCIMAQGLATGKLKPVASISDTRMVTKLGITMLNKSYQWYVIIWTAVGMEICQLLLL